MMGNKFNGNSFLFDQETKTKHLILKNLINYYPKIQLSYIGSNNKAFFFSDKYKDKDGLCKINPIHTIVIQKQFSLNGQARILKKWCVDFKNVAFLNQSNEFIALCEHQIEKWEIHISCNIRKKFQRILKFPKECLGSNYNPYQLQVGIKGDWIVASKKTHIFFLEKEIDGTWNCVQDLNIWFYEFILNDQGNILLIKQDKDYSAEILVYIKNSSRVWTIIKKIENGYNYFLNNEQFVVAHRTDPMNIYEVSQNKEVTLIQELKLGLKSYEQIDYMISIKQSKLLLFQTYYNMYFFNKNNGQFSIKETIKKKSQPMTQSQEGFLINFDIIYGEYGVRNKRPGKIEILKLYGS